MAATATRERHAPAGSEPGEDGYPVRYEEVGGELVPFSLKPYPEAERPLYWNPLYPGCTMLFRARERNERGEFPTIQVETWNFGKFSPRNDWETHMTREWMKNSLEGCANPDDWKGVNHPEGADAEWRCQCTWSCGNYKAFRAHQRYLRHQESWVD